MFKRICYKSFIIIKIVLFIKILSCYVNIYEAFFINTYMYLFEAKKNTRKTKYTIINNRKC